MCPFLTHLLAYLSLDVFDEANFRKIKSENLPTTLQVPFLSHQHSTQDEKKDNTEFKSKTLLSFV
jgi:predicted RNA-binding protein